MPDRTLLEERVARVSEPGRPGAPSSPPPAAWANYDDHGALLRRWCSWLALGARVHAYGRSVRDEPLFAFEIGPAQARRVSLLMAGIHAMEWIGVAVGAAVVERLLADPPAERRVLVFPLVNVDGFREVEADLAAGRHRFRRANAGGADLNRNWPTHWRPRHRRTAVLPFLGGQGNGPASEPEIRGLLDLLDDRLGPDARLERALSLHSIGRRILYPYGGRWQPPTDVDLHRAAADEIRARLRERYRVTQCARWVPGAFSHGMEIDHLHDAYGALALLVECSWGGASWRRPRSWVSPPRIFNPVEPAAHVQDLAPPLEAFLRGPPPA